MTGVSSSKALEPGTASDGVQGMASDSAQDSPLEDMQSPDSVATHPFWSERAKLEVALAKARPSTLDSEALRFTNEEDGPERPADLDGRSREVREVRVDEEFLEPPYESPQKVCPEVKSDVTVPDAFQTTENEEVKTSVPDRASVHVQKLDLRESVDAVHSVQASGSVGAALEDQALEIAQLRSLVDHLQGALVQAEENRSFTSSSNQGFDMQQSPPVPASFSRPGLESMGFGSLESRQLGPLNSPIPNPLVGPVYDAMQAKAYPMPPVMPGPSVIRSPPPAPPTPESKLLPMSQPIAIPEVYHMSSRQSVDPFKEIVLVHGQPHRWVQWGDKLGLEPVIPTGRERSPSPPPPKTTPPPSPPPYNPVLEGRSSSFQALGEPNMQALVLMKGEGQDLSSRVIGDLDSSGVECHLISQLIHSHVPRPHWS